MQIVFYIRLSNSITYSKISLRMSLNIIPGPISTFHIRLAEKFNCFHFVDRYVY